MSWFLGLSIVRFLEFVQGSLIPQMLPFDGTNKRSIAILDNCSVHYIPEVAEEFRKAGILVYTTIQPRLYADRTLF